MIHAYDKIYLDKARIALGRMLDFAVYDLQYDIEEFFNLFIHSGVSARFEIGEFWTSWALAYYQWETSMRFVEIVQYVPIKEILALYSPYHEMDIRQFVDKMNALYTAAKPETNLKLLRQKAGLCQRELAELSGVPIRTIQQYEQRQKNINKAQAEYLVMFSRVLCCEVEDLMEKVGDRASLL